MNGIYDVVILGAGPAGLSAGIYAGRGCLDTLVIEKGQDGGQIAMTGSIENYPGQQLEGESGASLIARMAEQARRFGVQRVSDTIERAELAGEVKKLTGRRGVYLARTVILATGASPRPIGCRNEEQFVGGGISFCATCDAAFFQDLEVYVVGGGDAAVEEALHLTKYARRVTMIHRRDQLRAAKSIQEKAFHNPKLHFLWNTVVEEVGGEDGVLSSIMVRDLRTDQRTTLRADENDGMFGLFEFIGLTPCTRLFEGQVDLVGGYVRTDAELRTNLPGVFAAGDLRVKSFRQAITAAADGAIAAFQAGKYLEE
jgi:thioredoxin reductase (NADPH)